MPNPTAGDSHIDAIMTRISVSYAQQASNFVARRVFPVVPVQRKSDKYFVFDRNDFLRDEMRPRVHGEESVGSGYRLSTDSYDTEIEALHKDVGYDVAANTDAPLNAERNATVYLTQQALLRLERTWASDFFVTGKWATSTTPAALWDDYNASDPIGDIETGKETILGAIGMMPNKLVLSQAAYAALRRHPDIVDQYKYTTPDSITTSMLARLLEVDEVLVARAMRATNVEKETAAYSAIAGKHALLVYAATAPALDTPSGGYTFEWSGVSQGLGESVAVRTIDMPLRKATRYEIECAWDNKIVSSDAGYFYESIVS